MSQSSGFEGLSMPASSLLALKRAGFDTVSDLDGVSAESLSEDLKLPVSNCEDILSATRILKAPTSTLGSQTISVSSILSREQNPICISSAADKLLEGGLKRGHVLEISGPPGSPKERMMLNAVKSAVAAGDGVLFLDMQNMTLPATLSKELKANELPADTIEYGKCHTIIEFMAFIQNLPEYLDEHPKITFIVLNTLSFVFQHSLGLSPTTRSNLFERVKQILTKLCVLKQITVVVTSQMSTKILKEDGSSANFETGTQAILVPTLGLAYLPKGRSYRIVLIPDSPSSGVRLLSSPTHPEGKAPFVAEESYELIDGSVQLPNPIT